MEGLEPQEPQLGPQEPQEPKKAAKTEGLYPPLVPIWKLIWGHVGPKNRKKAILKACENDINFDIDFSSILEPLGPHFGTVLGLMLASKSNNK